MTNKSFSARSAVGSFRAAITVLDWVGIKVEKLFLCFFFLLLRVEGNESNFLLLFSISVALPMVVFLLPQCAFHELDQHVEPVVLWPLHYHHHRGRRFCYFRLTEWKRCWSLAQVYEYERERVGRNHNDIKFLHQDDRYFMTISLLPVYCC